MKKVYKLYKKKKVSSANWLLRHINDPFVKEAKKKGYVCRSAIKLNHLQEKFKILGPHLKNVLDLGCSPGGWSQVVKEHGVKSLVGVDLQPMTVTMDMTFLQGDFTETSLQASLKEMGPFQVILSDVAPTSSGHKATDRLRMESLLESLIDLTKHLLAPGGSLVFKSLRGGFNASLEKDIASLFKNLKAYKPPSTYKASSEIYCVAQGLKPLEVSLA